MNIGIVGSEDRKFTFGTKAIAISHIEEIITQEWRRRGTPPTIVSGHCHLGGVDIWAEEAADHFKLGKKIFPPKVHSWTAGYKPRNIQIAENSDIVYVIVVRDLPSGYKAEPWHKNSCYHCFRTSRYRKAQELGIGQHIKSGACWTAWYAIEKLGKEARWLIV